METKERIAAYRRQRRGGGLTRRQKRRVRKKDWHDLAAYAAKYEKQLIETAE